MGKSSKNHDLPEGWEIRESRSHKGKMYFHHPGREISFKSLPEVWAYETGMKQREKVATSHSANTDKEKKGASHSDSAVLSSKHHPSHVKTPQSGSSTSQVAGLVREPDALPFRMIYKATRKSTKKTGNPTSDALISKWNVLKELAYETPAGKRNAAAEKSSGSASKRSRVSDVASSKGSERCSTSSLAFGSGSKSSDTRKQRMPVNDKNNTHYSDVNRSSDLIASGSNSETKFIPRNVKKKHEMASQKESSKQSDKILDRKNVDEEHERIAKLADIQARINARVQKFPGLSSTTVFSTVPAKKNDKSKSLDEKPASCDFSKVTVCRPEKPVLCEEVSLYKGVGQRKTESNRFPADSGATPPVPCTTCKAPSACVCPRTQKRRSESRHATPYEKPKPATKKTKEAKGKDHKLKTKTSVPQEQPDMTRPDLTLPVPSGWAIPRKTREVPQPPSQPPEVGAGGGRQDGAAGPAELVPASAAAEGAAGAAAHPAADVSADAEDAEEQMEWDELQMSEEEVLSQIANLRDGGAATANGHPCEPAPGRVLTCPDVSPAPRGTATAERLTVVIDTNVLITDLGFVHDLRDSYLEGARTVLLIPWVVVQELDGLKMSKQSDLARRARAAVSFVLECLEAEDPGLTGQTAAEAVAAQTPLPGRVADDAVLECVLAASPPRLLLSDDKNLRAKTLLHSVRASDRHQLLRTMETQGVEEHISVTDEYLFCTAKFVLRKALSYAIRREMALVHGAAWRTAVAPRQPCGSLRHISACVRTYRQSVFHTCFGDRWPAWLRLLRLATRLVLTPSERRSLCAAVADLLPTLRPSDHYSGLLAPAVAALRQARPLPPAALEPLGLCFTDPAGSSLRAGSTGGQSPRPSRDPSPATAAEPAALSADGHAARRRKPAPVPAEGARLTPQPRPAAESACSRSSGLVDDDTVMAAGGTRPETKVEPGTEPEPDLELVRTLFDDVWSYINTCCGVLLDAAGVSHQLQYALPPMPPSAEQCAAFLPQLGAAVQTLAEALKRLMSVSVVALRPDGAELATTSGALLTLAQLAGHAAQLSPSQLHAFVKLPEHRVLLGEGLQRLVDYLQSLELLQRMVS